MIQTNDAAQQQAQTTPVANAATASTGRLLDSKAALAILNARATLRPTDVGGIFQLYVQGEGQFLPKGHKYQANGVDRENQFDRIIHNLRANSALLMAENKQLFTDALKAESAGDTQKAHDLFNEYLNTIQLSFSVIQPSSRSFHHGMAVQAECGLTTNAAGKQVIIVNNVAPIAPKAAPKVTFNVADLITA